MPLYIQCFHRMFSSDGTYMFHCISVTVWLQSVTGIMSIFPGGISNLPESQTKTCSGLPWKSKTIDVLKPKRGIKGFWGGHQTRVVQVPAGQFLGTSFWKYLKYQYTVNPVLRDHRHESDHLSWITAMRDHLSWKTTFLGRRSLPTSQYIWTCHQRPPVLREITFVANWVVLQDRFYCI